MYADSIYILEQLANPLVFVAVLPLLVIFGASVWVTVHSLAWCLKAPKPMVSVRATVSPAEEALKEVHTTKPPAPPPVAFVVPVTPSKVFIPTVSAPELSVLEEKLQQAKQQVEKEQELRRELETKTTKLTSQFEEVVHEVEHIFHQNLRAPGLEELSQRLGLIKKGEALPPREAKPDEPPAVPNKNPEKLLIAEQAGEIRKLKDVVAFYREKYGE